jgi:hypothetical protein
LVLPAAYFLLRGNYSAGQKSLLIIWSYLSILSEWKRPKNLMMSRYEIHRGAQDDKKAFRKSHKSQTNGNFLVGADPGVRPGGRPVGTPSFLAEIMEDLWFPERLPCRG